MLRWEDCCRAVTAALSRRLQQFCVEFVCSICVWMGFLSQSKNMFIWLKSSTVLSISVSENMNGCLCKLVNSQSRPGYILPQWLFEIGNSFPMTLNGKCNQREWMDGVRRKKYVTAEVSHEITNKRMVHFLLTQNKDKSKINTCLSKQKKRVFWTFFFLLVTFYFKGCA